MIVEGFETETILVDGEAVDGVLVSPAETDRLLPDDIALPAGARVEYRLDIPKAFAARLSGQRVEVRGQAYEVADHPAYAEANTPGAWNRVALAYRLERDDNALIAVVVLSATVDEAGYPIPSEDTAYEGPAQARMERGSLGAGAALAHDAPEEWVFVFPWSAALEGVPASAVRVDFGGSRLHATSVDDVEGKGVHASVRAVRRG